MSSKTFINRIKKVFLYSVLILFPVFSFAANPAITSKTLPNGLRVLIYERSGSQFASINLCYNVGIKNETDSNGLSRLLACMMGNKSTKPKDVVFAEKIHKLNGFTQMQVDADKTIFSTQVPSKNIEKVLEGEAARMNDLLITEETIDYYSAQAELQDRLLMNSWLDQFQRTRNLLIYPENYPYRYKHIGKKAGPNECFAFYRTYYHPANATLVIVTSTKAATVLPMIERQLGMVYKKGQSGTIPGPAPLRWPVELLRSLSPSTASTVMSFFVQTPGPSDSLYYAFRVLDYLISGKGGILADYPGVIQVSHSPTQGLFPYYYSIDVVAVADAKNKLERNLDELFGRYLYKGFADHRVEAAKEYLMQRPPKLWKASNTELAQYLQEGLFYQNDAEARFKSEAGFAAVTEQQVRLCLRKYFLEDAHVKTFNY